MDKETRPTRKTQSWARSQIAHAYAEKAAELEKLLSQRASLAAEQLDNEEKTSAAERALAEIAADFLNVIGASAITVSTPPRNEVFP